MHYIKFNSFAVMETVQQTYKDPQVKKGLPIYMVFVTHFVFLIGYPTGSRAFHNGPNAYYEGIRGCFVTRHLNFVCPRTYDSMLGRSEISTIQCVHRAQKRQL